MLFGGGGSGKGYVSGEEGGGGQVGAARQPANRRLAERCECLCAFICVVKACDRDVHVVCARACMCMRVEHVFESTLACVHDDTHTHTHTHTPVAGYSPQHVSGSRCSAECSAGLLLHYY